MDHGQGHGQGICLGWSVSILEPRAAEGGDAWLGEKWDLGKPRVSRLMSPKKEPSIYQGRYFWYKSYMYIYIYYTYNLYIYIYIVFFWGGGPSIH